jgi:hypothetical protein
MHPILLTNATTEVGNELVTNCGNECTRGVDKLTVVIMHALIN